MERVNAVISRPAFGCRIFDSRLRVVPRFSLPLGLAEFVAYLDRKRRLPRCRQPNAANLRGFGMAILWVENRKEYKLPHGFRRIGNRRARSRFAE